MQLERYEYERKRTYVEYFFFSEGPRGRIRKVVRFERLIPNKPYYNLVLGDWREEWNNIDSESVSNNGDTEKVFLTVADIIVDFIAIFSNAKVVVWGNNSGKISGMTVLLFAGKNQYF